MCLPACSLAGGRHEMLPTERAEQQLKATSAKSNSRAKVKEAAFQSQYCP
jgi:hypothetical protein